MIDWSQRTVTQQFSPLGLQVLSKVFSHSTAEVSVEWADEIGLWIFREQVDEVTATFMLIRWGHFETATLDVVYGEPKLSKVLGFRARGTTA